MDVIDDGGISPDVFTSHVKELRCTCVKERTSSASGITGLTHAFLTGSIATGSSFVPDSSGVLHTSEFYESELIPIYQLIDLSPQSEPRTKFRVWVEQKHVTFFNRTFDNLAAGTIPFSINDTATVEESGVAYKYNISRIELDPPSLTPTVN